EGANAYDVFDYVVAALLHTGFNPEKQSVGIVGLGRIGRKVFAFLNKIGVRTFYFDPFLKNSGSLDAVLECDYVTFHVPLTRTGEHATEGMLNAEY
ncbi:MAG TPA: NAD(P)-dependent oxidoreductase, partial [Turneriella sp.]|nr:NAD(P)-dependent oxidoreductase [Turneriella sp.]